MQIYFYTNDFMDIPKARGLPSILVQFVILPILH